MLKHFPFVARNVLRNKRRSLLTIASIAVSLCLLGVLLALYIGLFHAPDSSPAQALRVVTRHRVSLTQDFPVSHRQVIERVPGVEATTYWAWFGGTYKEPKNFFARFGVDPKTVFTIYPDLVLPPDQRSTFQSMQTACVAGKPLADKFGWKLGERITLVGDIFPVTLELTLVGIFDNTAAPDDASILFFNYNYLRESLAGSPSRQDRVGAFMLRVDNPDLVPEVAKTIDGQFDNSPYPTRTESEKQFALSFVAFLGNLKLFLAAICAAVLFTILLVSANTVAMAVRERTRETAILRTLGYAPVEILGMILGEAGLLGLIGGAIGAVLATALASVLAAGARASGGGFQVAVPGPEIWGVLLVVSVFVGVVSAIFPAWVASRRPVVDSIRYAG